MDMRQNKNIMLSMEEIRELKEQSPNRSGCWEIDWGPETFSQASKNAKNKSILTLVVHRESYYVLEMHLSHSDEIGKGVSAFVNAIKKKMVLPDIIMVRDKILADELASVAEVLSCKIQISPLKAIPQIRRDLRRLMS